LIVVLVFISRSANFVTLDPSSAGLPERGRPVINRTCENVVVR